MDTNVLIEKITREVMKKVNNQLFDEFNQERSPGCRGDILVIIPGYLSKGEKFLKYIKKENEDYSFVFAAYGSTEDIDLNLFDKILDMSASEGKRKLSGMIDEFRKIYYLSPRLETIKAIGNLNDSRFSEWLIIQSLMKDTEVHILVDYELSENPATGAKKIVRDLLDDISSMGIKINFIERTNLKPVNSKSNNINNKKLITKKKINSLWEQGHKSINLNNAIITPLAIDRARKLGLKINN